MRKIIIETVCIVTLLNVPSAMAGGGLFEYGLGAHYGSYSVDDPDGQTEHTTAGAFSAVLIYTKNTKWRWWYDANYVKYDLDYGTNSVGQSVKSIHIDAILQRGFALPLYIDGWVGLGVGMGLNTFTDRATVDEQGFEDQRFEDRDETNFSAIANAGVTFGGKDTRFVISGKYYMPIDNDIETLNIGAYIVFNYD